MLLLETEAVELTNERVENAVAAAVGPPAGASAPSGIPAHDNDRRASSGAHVPVKPVEPVEPVEVLINFKLAFFKQRVSNLVKFTNGRRWGKDGGRLFPVYRHLF